VRRTLVAILFASLAVSAAGAHEGHNHTIMGTVASVHAASLNIKATTGKTASVLLNDKTKIVRGTARVRAGDLKIGERVVATAVEQKDKTMVAKEVRVAAGPVKH